MSDFAERAGKRGESPRLTDADWTRLAVLQPLIERHAEVVSAVFWRHQLSLGSARELLAEPGTLERARREHRAYLLSLARPPAGRETPPPSCVGSAGLHLSLLAPLAREACAGNELQAEAVLSSLEKRLFLDAERACRADFDSRLAAHRAHIDELVETNLGLTRRCAQLERELEEARGLRPVAAREQGREVSRATPFRRPGAPKRSTILVVDDDQGWVELVNTMLSGPAAVVCPATDPQWALALARLYELDLAIIDWQLDDPLSGLELGRRLQRIHPGLKCILISGYPEDSVGEAALEAGFSRFLAKPFDVEALRGAVQQVLGEPHRR